MYRLYYSWTSLKNNKGTLQKHLLYKRITGFDKVQKHRPESTGREVSPDSRSLSLPTLTPTLLPRPQGSAASVLSSHSLLRLYQLLKVNEAVGQWRDQKYGHRICLMQYHIHQFSSHMFFKLPFFNLNDQWHQNLCCSLKYSRKNNKTVN